MAGSRVHARRQRMVGAAGLAALAADAAKYARLPAVDFASHRRL